MTSDRLQELFHTRSALVHVGHFSRHDLQSLFAVFVICHRLRSPRSSFDDEPFEQFSLTQDVLNVPTARH